MSRLTAGPDAGAALLMQHVQALARLGIAEWDLRSGQVTWSDEQYRIYGWEPGAVAADLETLLARVYPADVPRVRHGFEQARSGQTASPIEHRILHPGGGLRTLQARSLVLLDPAGTPHRMVSTTVDITEHKEAATRMVFADRMHSVGTIAAGVAHEINNPLAFISANLELITAALGGPLLPELARMLDETQYGIRRIQNIVRGLQLFGQFEEDRRAPLDVVRVVELALMMASSALQHRATLVQELGAVPKVVANHARLGQVFLNLILNAVEAAPIGDPERHQIRIVTRGDEAGRANIEIHDNGRGIPLELQGRIFDPFFTTKPIGEGPGLGLSMCHGIVRSLGGEITFHSEPGVGTVFRVVLPPAGPEAPPEPLVPAALPERPIVTDTARSTVLIVDDERMFANALRRLLSRDNHLITTLNSGDDAVALIRSGQRFDAILSDLMMPGMTGMDVHAELATFAPDQAARMLFLTGGAFSAAAKLFLERIPNPWFEKPCDLQVLREAIQRMAQR